MGKKTGNDKLNEYWTVDRCTLSLSIAFLDDIEEAMDKQGVNRTELAKRMGISGARITQMLNKPPRNITLRTAVRLARALNLKVSLVLYDDETGSNAPQFPAVFRVPWELAGKPKDGWDLEELQKKSEQEP